jgi:iron-sulfur cluster repair protein YtfE (RIC family)
METRSETRVADVATEYPATIRVFQRYGIDFCCGGKRPLSEAWGELKLEFGQLRQDLDRTRSGRGPSPPSRRPASWTRPTRPSWRAAPSS